MVIDWKFETTRNLFVAPTNNILVAYDALQVLLYCIVLYCIVLYCIVLKPAYWKDVGAYNNNNNNNNNNNLITV